MTEARTDSAIDAMKAAQTDAKAGAAAAIELSLISHTNAGKTTLARTLLGRDIGEVRDAPHVTEVAESHTLIETAEGDVLRLWDTPGFGDSMRLVRRLRNAGNPVGWILREVWDRFRDRPLWCSQQAVRAARDSADVVLYLVNAAEDPRDAAYVAAELQILAWIGKPVLVLLNQTGPPRSAADESAEQERWRAHVASIAVVCGVLTLDAFARCWVQEGELLGRVAALLPAGKRPAMLRLAAAWRSRSLQRFERSMQALAQQLMAAVRDREPLDRSASPRGLAKLLEVFGVGKAAALEAREQAMAALAQRLDAQIRTGTDVLIGLHGLEGHAAATVLQRLRENYAIREPVSESKAAAWGGVVTGALTGLKADLAAGGLSFGAGLLTGALVGALGGAGAARGFNLVRGSDQTLVAWSAEFLDALVRSALLRYLAVAHFGRGRGEFAQAEAPAFWQDAAARAVERRRPTFEALWENARSVQDGMQDGMQDDGQAAADLQMILAQTAQELLAELYPGAADLRLDPP